MGYHNSLEAGSQIDFYLIEEPVARSGMASIYRAIDTRDNRVVALKIPHPDLEADRIPSTALSASLELAGSSTIPM